MIRLGPETCQVFEIATGAEWLETNGLGSYASGTVAGAHTRRYHGLLVAALAPPVRRFVLLAKVEEAVGEGAERVELSANQYRGAVHPQGFRLVREFSLSPFPTWEFELPHGRLRKRCLMARDRQATLLRYELLDGEPVPLELRPLLAFRDYHHLTTENPVLDRRAEVGEGRVRLAPYPGLPSLWLFHTGERFRGEGGDWYRGFEYREELARGLAGHEDLFSPGVFEFTLAPGRPAWLVATLDPGFPLTEVGRIEEEEARRRASLAGGLPGADPLGQALAQAADQFLVQRGEGASVIAGYPWFTDWGRDTMISLPGLTLLTGRHAEARAILVTFARAVDQGMLPNRFPDGAEPPEYNTLDATLWFLHAVREYVRASGDRTLLRELYPVLAEIVAHHRRGTRHGIRVDGDGLLQGGAPGVQLTWMDAKVGDWVVTPRHGKPVEVNALWYNGLKAMEELARSLRRTREAGQYGRWAAECRRAFNRAFWNPEAGCLYDCLGPEGPDPAIRPNQLLAISLPFPVLDRARWASVLAVAERELLTPYGLRTLSPRDPRYRGVYEGDQPSRDGAYHQGTVWPWLLGPYVEARLRMRGRTARARAEIRPLLDPLVEHLAVAGLGTVSEIFDGDPPHRPRGCIAQAWSVGELLRVRAMLAPPSRRGRSARPGAQKPRRG